MKKQLRRWISGLLVFTLCAGLLAACSRPSNGGDETGGNSPGKSDGKDSVSAQINKNVIYKSTPLEFGPELDDIDDVNQIILSGDTMYIAGSRYDQETWEYSYYIFSADRDGTNKKKIYEYREGEDKYPGIGIMEAAEADAPTEDTGESSGEPQEDTSDVYTGENISRLVGDGQGNLIETISFWKQSEDEYTSGMRMVKVDRDGNELWEFNFENDAYVSDLVCGGGMILANTGDLLYIFDGNGRMIRQTEMSGDYWIRSLVALEDGRVYAFYYDNSGGVSSEALAPLDLETGKLGEAIIGSWANKSFDLMPGIGYDLFLRNNLMIAGYNIGDENYTELLNFVDSDIDAANLSFICPSGDGQFLMGVYSTEDWRVNLFELNKVDPADVKDKTVITLGMLYNDYSVSSEVIKFNRNSEDYRIRLKLYNDYSTKDNPDGGVSQLNNDILMGKMPDILMVDRYSMPLDSYAQKGAFADLYPWIDSDPELRREDIMPNVLEAYSVDGKLYELIPWFSINTLAAKTSIVGNEPGWSIDEMLKLAAEYPDSDLFNMHTRDDILRIFMSYVGDQFIHDQGGTPACSFDSEEFIRLLEWAATFPEEIDYSKVDDSYWMNYESMWRSDQVLLMSAYISDFYNFKYNRGVTFGEPVTYIGYPTSEGNGSVLESYYSYAISAQSSNQEGAWQFIRHFLSSEFQESGNLGGFPVRISALRKMGEEAMKPYTYIDENGNEVEVEDTYWIGDQEVVIEPLTQEEVDGYIEYMMTVNRVYSLNTDVLNIITEEAASFFSGQKPAAEAARIIQSRAKIFLAENS